MSVIYFIAIRMSGKNFNTFFLNVPASTCPLSFFDQHSKFLATTVDAIAGLRLDEVESHV